MRWSYCSFSTYLSISEKAAASTHRKRDWHQCVGRGMLLLESDRQFQNPHQQGKKYETIHVAYNSSLVAFSFLCIFLFFIAGYLISLTREISPPKILSFEKLHFLTK